MICHKNLIAPFTMFLINDGYSYEVGKGVVYFDKPTKPQARVNQHGQMNTAAINRYSVFLKMWLQHGKDFIIKLSAQANMMMVRK